MITERVSDREEFGRALATARRTRGLTQNDLATSMGVRQPTIADWENVTGATPTPLDVFRIEEALELPPGHLSKHLGYAPLPAEMKGAAPSFRAVVLDDPLLEERDKDAILGLYETLTAGRGRRAPRRRS